MTGRRDKEFLIIQSEWYKKLEQSGFKDIESKRGKLKEYDRRTNQFELRELVYEFYVALDHYLTESGDIPEIERHVLQMYSEGMYMGAISERLKMTRWDVRVVIDKHKKILFHLR